MKEYEQELKLQITERQYFRLTDGTDAVEQFNYYFVSEKGYQNNDCVRLRKKEGVFTLTYKKRLGNHDGVTQSDEYSCEIPFEQALVFLQNGFSARLLETTFNLQFDNKWFYCCGCLVTRRSVVAFSGFVLEVDKNEYLGVTDYELECEHNDYAQLEQLKGLLRFSFNVEGIASKTKAERFFEIYQKDKK